MGYNCVKNRKQMVGISRQVSRPKEVTCNSFTICDEALADWKRDTGVSQTAKFADNTVLLRVVKVRG